MSTGRFKQGMLCILNPSAWHILTYGEASGRCFCLSGTLVQLTDKRNLHWYFTENLKCKSPVCKFIINGAEERYLTPLPPEEDVRAFDATKEKEKEIT